MNFETWKSRLGWLAMVAAILISGKMAQADPEVQASKQADDEKALIADPPADVLKERPWLGLHCFPAEPALRAQLKLPEGQGLVVGSVAPESPAAKAGIQSNDILLKAGDLPLKEVADLVSAIEQSIGKATKIELVRAGEKQTLEVTPGVREVEIRAYELLPDQGVVDRWLERMPRAVEGLPDRMRLFRAGVPLAASFPKELTLNVTKEGDQPAKVVIKKGDQQWETTDDKLGELPEEVRAPVEVFLGKIPTAFPAGATYIIPPPPGTPPAVGPVEGADRAVERGRQYLRRQAEDARRHAADAERGLRDEAGDQVERAGRRIEQLEQQLRGRLQKLDRLIEERTRALEGTPAKPATPAVPVTPAEPAAPAEPATPPAKPEPTGPELPAPDTN